MYEKVQPTLVPIILDAVNGINGNNGWHFHDSTIGVECCYSSIYHFFCDVVQEKAGPLSWLLPTSASGRQNFTCPLAPGKRNSHLHNRYIEKGSSQPEVEAAQKNLVEEMEE